MIRLPFTGTYSLELITAQNGAQVVVCYSDKITTAYTGGVQATSITSATTTTICATPAAAAIRDIDEINIKNTYAGSHTVTVQLDANGTNYPLLVAALLTDESLNYTHGSGWQAKDANGNTKTTPLTAMTSAQLAAIVSDETGSGALVFGTAPTLDNVVAKGTWTASGTFTLPAFTLGGAITGNSQNISGLGAVSATTVSASSYYKCEAALPYIWMVESDQAADAKGWVTRINGGAYQLIRVNDAGASVATALSIDRSGNAALHTNTTPGVDNTYDLGSTSYRWKTGYFVDVNASGNVTLNDAATDTVKVNGTLGIMGATPSINGHCILAGDTLTGAATGRGYRNGQTIDSGITTSYYGYVTIVATKAAAFTLTDLAHYVASPATIGATSAITNQYGFQAQALAGATNNYAFYASSTNVAGRWNFYAAGDAPNYFAGVVNVEDGTALLPSIVNNGDPNTGIWFPAADTVAVSTGGTERVRIDSAGNVGVGYATPSNMTGTIKAVVGSGVAGTAGAITCYSGADSYGALFFADGTIGNQLYRGGLEYVHSTDTLKVYSSGTSRIHVDSSGNTLPGADNDYNLGSATARWKGIYASEGLYIGGTTSANLLDDYEEGTFTPVVVGGTDAGAGTYTAQIGRYTKVGNRVFINIKLTWSAHTGTGTMSIGGLPVTSENTTGNLHSLSITTSSMAYNGSIKCLVNKGATTAGLYSDVSNTGIAALALDTAGELYITGHYQTA